MSKYIITLFLMLTTVNFTKASHTRTEEPVSPAAMAISKRFDIGIEIAAFLAIKHGISTPKDLIGNTSAIGHINKAVKNIRHNENKARKGSKK